MKVSIRFGSAYLQRSVVGIGSGVTLSSLVIEPISLERHCLRDVSDLEGFWALARLDLDP